MNSRSFTDREEGKVNKPRQEEGSVAARKEKKSGVWEREEGERGKREKEREVTAETASSFEHPKKGERKNARGFTLMYCPRGERERERIDGEKGGRIKRTEKRKRRAGLGGRNICRLCRAGQRHPPVSRERAACRETKIKTRRIPCANTCVSGVAYDINRISVFYWWEILFYVWYRRFNFDINRYLNISDILAVIQIISIPGAM